MNREQKNHSKAIIFSSIIVLSVIGIGIIGLLSPEGYSYELSSFDSYDSFITFLQKQQTQKDHYYSSEPSLRMMESTDSMQLASGDSKAQNSVSYSETNIQVAGVDEPDLVKTDGSFIYILSETDLFIVQSYPVGSSELVSTIQLNSSYQYSSFFVYENNLIVFAQSYPTYYWSHYDYPLLEKDQVDDTTDGEDIEESHSTNQSIITPRPGNWSVSQVAIFVYDLSDKQQPVLGKSIKIDGSFVDARRIDATVYVVASENTYDIFRTIDGNDYVQIPKISVDGTTKQLAPHQIHYVDEPDEANKLTHVLTFNLSSFKYDEKSFLIGSTHELYMSKNHLYLTYTSYDYSFSMFGSRSYEETREKTKIHKIKLSNDDITYVASGEVPGRLLNQFSMDEHDSYFRIATTTGYIWNEDRPSQNRVYVLDENLNTVSSINDIASGEELYAARFMGDTAYLVTFKNTDPFFTIDLSDPLNPKVLGELKLPGYSDYLHPYDEDHIIGIGKDTVASDDPNFAWYQGVKLALFNVSDIDNPVLVDTEVIGDRGSSTPVLSDHKALLFDKNKQLLSLPVSVYEISDEDKKDYENNPGTYGRFQYQGAYVFTVTSEGFSFRNCITHLNQSSLDALQNHSWYRGNDERFIHRSLYIDNVLYTISKTMIQAHTLDDVSFVNQVVLED